MRKLPTGTVTLLFTDIEGSTRLLQQLGERYAALLKEHRRLLRTAFEQRNGHEVDTQGDAFFVVFERAADAVAAAVDVQQAHFHASWPDDVAVRVRMGLHTGEPQPAEEGYIGLDVHRAARIMCAAHGGQVLLSRETFDLVNPDLMDGVRVRGLGAYHLKDIAGLSELFQLVIPGLPVDFPPIVNSHRPLRNIPSPSTSFVGREQETAAILKLLRREDVRLLTLIGPAGVGKTRLALQAAAQMTDLGLFAGGVSFVALDQVSDAGGVVTALAQALNVQEEKGSSLLERVRAALCEQSLLLILDNFEQVVAARPLIAELLAACPQLKVIVTSRVLLHMQAEHIFEVPPLSLPDSAALPDLEALSQYAAIALFVQRAQAVQPDFRLNIANAPAIAKICTRLDGIPLAIELAAARIRRFPPQTLLTQLERGLAVLTGDALDRPTRQQTLRGAIDWGYNLLSGEEQRVFRRLAVCANGTSQEAAESICAAAGGLEGSVLDTLESLVDKSMLQRRDGAGGVSDGTGERYWLLQTLREYGLERLAKAGEAETTFAACAAYYLAWTEQAAPQLSGAEQIDWLDRLSREYENVRTALEWLLKRATETEREKQVERAEKGEQALRLCLALASFWEIRGYFSEGLAFLERALANADGVSPSLRAQALSEASALALVLDDNERAESFLRASQLLFRQSGDKAAMANILRMQGNLSRAKCSYKLARRLLEEALALYREQGDRRGMAVTREDLALIALSQGDFSKARKLMEENLTRYRALGEQYHTAFTLFLLAHSYFLSRENLAKARMLAQESLALFREVGNRQYIAYVLNLQGQLALVAREYAEAHTLLEEALSIFNTLEDRFGKADTHIALARLATSQRDKQAARLHYQESWQLLRATEMKDVMATCFEGFGEVLLAEGAPERAVQLWATAAALRAAIVAPLPPISRSSYVQAVARARQLLGEQGFQTAWSQGRETPLDRVQLV